MSWHGIEGHDAVVERFRRALARGRLAGSFLFVGPEGVGKRTFALKLAQAMLCPTRPEAALDPCGTCPSCVQAAAGTHPDLDAVGKPADKSFIPLELLIGDREHRRREGLCHAIGLKPRLGRRKIALIDDADYLNPEGANALLKTLEEPPPQSVLILIGTSAAKQLPTIRSRCQVIRFQPLPVETVARLLVSTGGASDAAEARRIAPFGSGSVRRAMEAASPELRSFRGELWQRLAEPARDSVGLARATAAFVEAAGKEASLRRARLHHAIGFAAEFYRHLLRAQSGGAPADDRELRDRVAAAFERGQHSPEAAAARLDRCLDAAAWIDRNANQSTLIECWADHLAAPGQTTA